MEGPALSNPLRAGSFPLRSCQSCALAGEDFRGDAVTSVSVRLPHPLCQAKQPSFSHRYMYVGISKVCVLDLDLRSRKLDILLPVVFPPSEGSLIPHQLCLLEPSAHEFIACWVYNRIPLSRLGAV